MNSNDLDSFTRSSLLCYQHLSELGLPFVSYENNDFYALKSGINNPWFNFLLLKDFSSDSLKKGKDHFSSLPFEYTFGSRYADLIETCDDLGLIFGEKTSGSILQMKDFCKEAFLNDTIIFQPVENEMHLKWWVNLTSLGYRLPKTNVKDFFYPIYQAGCSKFNFSLCLLGGVPAAAGLVFSDPPYCSILSLVSLSQFRNQDVAFFLLQEQLALAQKQNIRECTVQANTFGISALENSVYDRLGFEAQHNFLTYLFIPKDPNSYL